MKALSESFEKINVHKEDIEDIVQILKEDNSDYEKKALVSNQEHGLRK